MGLFGNLFGRGDAADDLCPICSAKLPSSLIPFNGTQKLTDGRICKECTAQISPNVSGVKQMTVNEIAAHLQYRAQNQMALQYFNETHRIQAGGVTIALDWNQQQIVISKVADYRTANADILTLPQITGVQYEVNESHHPESRDMQDGYGPRQVPVYTYAFRFVILVNSPWFSSIQFNVNNRSSVELQEQDVLLDCLNDGDNLYQFLSSIGFPSTMTDNTSCGIASLRDGTAMTILMPPPPPPQPADPARDAVVMGAAAGVMMDQGRKEPQPAREPEKHEASRPAPAPQANRREEPRPSTQRHEPAQEQRQPKDQPGREENHRPSGQANQGRPGQAQQSNPGVQRRDADERRPRPAAQGSPRRTDNEDHSPQQAASGAARRDNANQMPQGGMGQQPTEQTGRNTRPGMNNTVPSERSATTGRGTQSNTAPQNIGRGPQSNAAPQNTGRGPQGNTSTTSGRPAQTSGRPQTQATTPSNSRTPSSAGSASNRSASNSRTAEPASSRTATTSKKEDNGRQPNRTERGGRPEGGPSQHGGPTGGPGRR